MTPQQQAEAILEKYTILLSLNKVQVELIEDTAIQCAITEVEAIIAENKANGVYEVFMEKWYGIIEHLKQML